MGSSRSGYSATLMYSGSFLQSLQDAPLVQPLGWLGRTLKADHAALHRAVAGEADESVAVWSASVWDAKQTDIHLASATDVSGIFTLTLPFFPITGQRWTVTLSRSGSTARPYSDRDARIAAEMIEPLRFVVCSWLQLQEELQLRATFEDVINAGDGGLILLDNHGQTTFINRSAQTILDTADGLVMAAGRITAVGFRDASRLQAGINYVIRQSAGEAPAGPATADQVTPIISIARRAAPPLSLAILALTASAHQPEPGVALCIVDPLSDISAGVGMACEMHGLTQAEIRLAKHLVAGLTLTDAAVAAHIQEQTARAYLRQIFSKMGVSRQAEMVRVILAGVVRIQARFISLPH
jgi:DNA-binding CsgD family transcriptional regulator/PAS domain-containing protein